MANKWGISKVVEEIVIQRDTKCVYCGIEFANNNESVGSKPSWEHIVNDIRIKEANNITLCCRSCNSSKGAKPIELWLKSDYCKRKGITENSVADVVKEAIINPPKLS